MANSPRYQGFIDPPYNVTFVDDSGAALDLTGCVSSNFTLTMLNADTRLSQQGTGTWTVANQTTNKGQASYQWTLNDMATPGPNWWIYTTVKLPAEPGPRGFDPELIAILPGTVGAGATPPGVLPNPGATLPFLNIRDFGGVGDNATDNTIMIANARAAARALGGARILYGPGTYLSSNQDISNDTGIYHEGSGKKTTIIKLKNGANTDLFSAYTSSINLAGATGTGSSTGITDFGFSNITLDGNKANQTAGTSYPLRFYGYGFTLHNLHIKNGYTGGLLYDYNGAFPSNDNIEPQLVNVKVYRNNGIGLQCGGPGDQQWVNVIVYFNGSHNIHNAPNGYGLQATNCHSWTPLPGNSAVSWLIETQGEFQNCEAESSDTCQVVVLNNRVVWNGGRIFSGPSAGGVGLQLGQQAGQTPYAGQIFQSAGVTTAQTPTGCMINTLFQGITSANGSLNFVNDGQFNTIIANINQTSGTAVHGTPDFSDTYLITVNGLTPDGTLGKGGGQQFASKSSAGFVVNNLVGNPLIYYNTNTKAVQIGPSVPLYGLNSDFFTPMWQLGKTNNGEITLGNSSSLFSGTGVPSNSLGANGDFYFRTDTPGTANQRLYVKSAGSWAGIL